jgi:hypothetical protein
MIRLKLLITGATGLAVAIFATAWLAYSHARSDARVGTTSESDRLR